MTDYFDLPNLTGNLITAALQLRYIGKADLRFVTGFFISMLEQSFPNLECLCMMDNPAAPSYFNDGTYEQYLDYRYSEISNLI